MEPAPESASSAPPPPDGSEPARPGPGPPEATTSTDLARGLLVAASLVVVVAGLRAAAALFVPVVLALFLALLSWPLLEWLLGRGVRPLPAVLLTILADSAVLAVGVLMVTTTFIDFADAAPAYLELLTLRFKAGLDRLVAEGIVLSEWIDPDRFSLSPLVDMAGGIVRGTVRGVASFFGYASLVVLTMIFMLAEALGLPAKLERVFRDRGGAPVELVEVARDVRRYLAIKTLVSAGTGLLIGAWLALLGVEFAVFWALVAFLLNYVPMIGSIVAAVPTVLLVWVQDGSPAALLVAAGYLVVNTVIGNLLEPHLMGRRFGLSSLAVFLALGFWGWVWGPVGMLVAVPLTVTIKIFLAHTEGLAWLAVLLGTTSATSA